MLIVMHENKIKLIFITFAIAVSYALLIWLALVFLPLFIPPLWFTALFSTKSQALMPWIKIRHTAIVFLVAVPLGFALLKILGKHAIIGGLVVGSLVAAYSEIYNCILLIRFEVVPNVSQYIKFRLHDPMVPVWVPLTDFIVLTGAVPLTIWIINKIKLMHNNGVKADAD
jgi:hypothetical protein